MCFAFDARPPIAPIAGAAVDSERITLTSADGTEFMAFAARGDQPGGPAMVILPDVRGLFHFYEELALRFAERGIDAVTIDYFGRTTELDSSRDEDFEFMEHIKQTRMGTVSADVAAAVAHLREGGAERPVFTVGFCFGGAHSWMQARAGLGLAGVVGFYGRPVGFNMGQEPESPVDHAAEFSCPVLGLMGGADQGIPPESVRAFDEALEAAGVEHEIVTSEGAPHSFFDRHQPTYQADSDDAWSRIMALIERNS